MNGHGGRERQLFELERLAKAGLTQPLGLMQRGVVGRIMAVQSGEGDVERGLLEMGFVEGANLGQQLRLAYNRQRQEEIIEEIEVILLSADLLAGEESRPSTPA